MNKKTKFILGASLIPIGIIISLFFGTDGVFYYLLGLLSILLGMLFSL